MGKGDNKIKWGDFLALAILNANQLYLQKRILKTLSLWPRSNISHISVYTSQFFLYLIHKTMRWKKLTKWLFNPIQDGPSLCCSRVGRGLKDPAPRNLSYISANNETWHSYTLHKGDPKKIWITRCTPWIQSCWYQKFFTRNQQFLLYQEIQIQIEF